MGPKKPPSAGSDSGLWPPQGQSRFFGPINPISHLSFIQIQRIEFFLSTKLFSTKDRRRENKPPPAGFDFGLRPSQGQSRFLDTIHFPAYPSNIFRARFLLFYISIIFSKGPERGDRICLYRSGLVVWRGLWMVLRGNALGPWHTMKRRLL